MNYELLNDYENRGTDKYGELLKNWNLMSELELVNNDSSIKKSIRENKRLIRRYNQPIFNEGKYNKDRFLALDKLL